MSKSSKVCGVGSSDWVVMGSDVDIVIDSKTVTEEGLPFFLAAFGVRWDDPSAAAFLFLFFFSTTSGAFCCKS